MKIQNRKEIGINNTSAKNVAKTVLKRVKIVAERIRYNKEKILTTVKESVEELLNQLPEKIKPDGHIDTYSVVFAIWGTCNRGVLELEDADNKINLKLHAFSNPFRCDDFFGVVSECSHSDIENYLKNEIDFDELYEKVISVSEAVDDYWDEIEKAGGVI
ncbi:MAG: hypothetical protein IJD40_11355 [Lachnospiraceae bacterium]|nr:hypothetical protein [Lachnospiraceae bacterium]